MIIKSLSRKQPSFQTLIKYITQTKKAHDNKQTLGRNIYADTNQTRAIIEEFEENAYNLKSLKNWNYLYHEIISLDSSTMEHIKIDEQVKILSDIGDKYLEMRATNNLSYWKIHTDTKHIHLHLCISANEINSDKRFRLSKFTFNQIQKDLENYKNKKYPGIEAKSIYNKTHNALKVSKNEQELLNRTQKPTLKGLFKAKLEKILDSATSYENFLKELKSAKIEIVKRWNTITAKNLIDWNKYRLKTLGLLDKLEDVKTRVEKIKERIEDIKNFKTLQINKEITMNASQAKQIAMRDLLSCLWIKEWKTHSGDIWYKSPFRDESTPSFKINISKNIWYDHGAWKGWNILDFMMLYKRCNFTEALKHIANATQLNLFTTQTDSKTILASKKKDTQEKSNTLSLTKTKAFANEALIQYLKNRAINPSIAKKYIHETYYKLGDKSYFWVSLKNDSDGVELNNKYFKWIIGAKDITSINNNADVLVVFEGMMDFLSYVSVTPNIENKNILVLNSVSMIKKWVEHIKAWNYKKIESFLDNDKAWKDATWFLKEQLENEITSKEIIFKTKSNMYKKYKDFNDYILARRDKKIQDIELLKNDRVLERIRQRE